MQFSGFVLRRDQFILMALTCKSQSVTLRTGLPAGFSLSSMCREPSLNASVGLAIRTSCHRIRCLWPPNLYIRTVAEFLYADKRSDGRHPHLIDESRSFKNVFPARESILKVVHVLSAEIGERA